jgi:hypothetical protein
MVTRDALLTHRPVAQTSGATGGDDGLSVQEHQPQVRAESALVFPLPPSGDRHATARTGDSGQGRLEPRTLTTREALGGDRDWPGLAQGFARGRHVLMHKTGQERVDVVSGVTSLRPARATPGRLLALGQGQWQLEHQSHGVRDGTCDADRSQGRCGTMPHVMAA